MTEGVDVRIEEDEPTASRDAPEELRLRQVPKYVPRTLGRYEIVGGLGKGGMATVYLGRSAAESGFHRLVAIKVLHPHLSEDEAFVTMLLDEARIAARLHHPNVVPIVDLGADEGLHYVVMEYVEGCSLFSLLAKNRENRPPRLVVPIVLDALAGLHAAHELRGDADEPLNLVHRDVSPQNVLVGMEGTARITDFGVARAEARINTTRPGANQIKGKIGFLSPEQLRGGDIDRRSDVFAAGVTLWSALTGKRLFHDPSSEAATMTKTLLMPIPKPSTIGLGPPAAFDTVCMRALDRDPANRFASALEMEDALRQAASEIGQLGSRQEVADWMARAFGGELAARRAAVRVAVSAGRASDIAAPASSGLRMMPAVGSIHPGEEDTPPTITALAAPPRSRKWPLLAAVGGLAVVIAAGAFFFVHGSPKTPPLVTAAEATTAPATPTATAPATATATPPATATAASTTPAVPVTATAAPPSLAARVRRVPPTAHKSTPPATTAPTHWDKDSPVPPP